MPEPAAFSFCSPRGDCAAATNALSTQLWTYLDTPDPPTAHMLPPLQGPGPCTHLALEHRRWLVRGCSDGTLHMNLLEQPTRSLPFGQHPGPIVALRPLHNQRLLSLSEEGQARLWDLNQRLQIHRFDLEGSPLDLDISPSQRLLAALVRRADASSELQLRTLPEGRLLSRRTQSAGHCLELLSDDRLLVGGPEALTLLRAPDLLYLATLEQLESPWVSQWGQSRVAFCPLESSADGGLLLHGFKRRRVLRRLLELPEAPLSPQAYPTDTSPANQGFEEGPTGGCPQGWRCSEQDSVQVVEDCGSGSGRCVRLIGPLGDDEFANLLQRIPGYLYRGRWIRFSARVRVDPISQGRAQLWIRADRFQAPPMGLFDNMEDRPIRAPEWQRYEIVGRVDEAVDQLTFGLMVFGEGARAWIDDVRLEVLPETDPAVALARARFGR